MKTIAIAAQKGGAGKTTTALAVSAGLHDDGKKVLIIDLDNQCNTSMVLSAGSGTQYQNITDALAGKGSKKPLEPCQNGYILPSTAFLSDSSINALSDIKTITNAYSRDFDYCVIDCPPALGMLTMAALAASDFVVVPVKTDVFGYAAVQATAATIATVKGKLNKKLRFLGVLPCMVNSRTRIAADFLQALEDLAAGYKCRLYAPIRASAAVQEAQALKQGNIFQYAPRTGAAIDYKAFLEDLKGDIS